MLDNAATYVICIVYKDALTFFIAFFCFCFLFNDFWSKQIANSLNATLVLKPIFPANGNHMTYRMFHHADAR